MPNTFRHQFLPSISRHSLHQATCAMHFVAVIGLFVQVMTSVVLLLRWATSGSIASQELAELQLHGWLALHYLVLLAPGTMLLLQCRLPSGATQEEITSQRRNAFGQR